jgi:hypothetical protein
VAHGTIRGEPSSTSKARRGCYGAKSAGWREALHVSRPVGGRSRPGPQGDVWSAHATSAGSSKTVLALSPTANHRRHVGTDAGEKLRRARAPADSFEALLLPSNQIVDRRILKNGSTPAEGSSEHTPMEVSHACPTQPIGI